MFPLNILLQKDVFRRSNVTRDETCGPASGDHDSLLVRDKTGVS